MTLDTATAISKSDSIINVTLKIIKVSNKIAPLAKKSIPSRGSGFDNETVIPEVSKKMKDNNLWVMQSSDGVEVADTELLFHYQMMVVDADSGEWLILPFTHATPRGSMTYNRDANQMVWTLNDKATSVAHTSALRIFLTKLFMIITPTQEKALPATPAPRQTQVNNERRTIAPAKPAANITAYADYQNGDIAANFADTTYVDENGEVVLPETPHDSDKRFDAIEPAYKDTDVITAQTHKSLIITLNQMGVSDDQRHAIIETLTDGATTSSKEITYADYYLLVKLLKIDRMGVLGGADKWLTARTVIAEKVSGGKATSLYALNSVQAISAHAKTASWLETKAGVPVPDMYKAL